MDIGSCRPGHRRVLASLALCLASSTAMAVPIVDLSTGKAANGSLIGFGMNDDDWTLVSAPSGVALGPITVVSPSRSYFADFGTQARWVSPDAGTNADAPFGYYTYSISLNLDFATLASTAVVGMYAADNKVIDISVNGQVAFVGPKAGIPEGTDEFSNKTAFTLPKSSFADGLNTVRVRVENMGPTLGNPTSFAMYATVEAIPEPSGYALMTGGLILLGLVVRRARASGGPMFVR